MRPKNASKLFQLLTLLLIIFLPLGSASAFRPAAPLSAPPASVTAYDLIAAMNTLRVSNGLPALVEDPIINAVAQGTADIMAANNMSWHIGDVRGRIKAAGYGGGGTVFATENFAVGTSLSIDQIMVMWSDPDHMRPAQTAAYCNVGAGVSDAGGGRVYYILQAAYVAGAACGSYTSSGSGTSSSGSSVVWGIIKPVKVAEPDADGRTYHVVEAGQSLWAIAIAYHVTIQDIETYNNISRSIPLALGIKLFIPNKNTEGYATPTPVGMIVPVQPDVDGRIVHTVAAYQTLTTISTAYKVSIDNILALNSLKADWPLQIGQKLVIDPGHFTPSPTPRPLTPIEMLTPAADGNYYHVVKSGENLSWIASLYGITANELMAWNSLPSADIRPDQKLLLKVTPPATATFTPGPPTATPTITPTLRPLTATATLHPTVTPTLTPTRVPALKAALSGGLPYFAGAIAAVGLIIYGFYARKKP